MLGRVILGLICLTAVFAQQQFQRQRQNNGNRFGGSDAFGSQQQPFMFDIDQTVGQDSFQKQGQSAGNAAAAGNAGAQGNGQATSINQASQEGNAEGTRANALSANTAQGVAPQTSGAAQAGGQLQTASQLRSNKAHQGTRFAMAPVATPNFGSNGFGNTAGMGFNTQGTNQGFGEFGAPAFGTSQRNNAAVRNQRTQQQNKSGGNAAAAGNAGAQGNGQASSINQANHKANADNTAADSLSANTAAGFAPVASGAAQADGQIARQKQIQTDFGFQNFGMNN